MQETFNTLKTLLQPFADQLSVVHDKENNYYLNTPPTIKKKKGEFFGAVQIKKNYVAFHLMPLYCNPDLLDGVSDELKKRMQGKSCFNFKKNEDSLISELGELVSSCFTDYQKQGKV